MNNQVDQDDEASSEVAELRAEVSKLSNRVKENQTSLFSAAHTLAEDIVAFLQGTREPHQLRPAFVGLLRAYLRSRAAIVSGGFVAVVFGGLQIYLLLRQNELIEQQGRFLEAQTRANQVSAVTELIMALDPRDSVRSQLAQTQLARFGETGVDVLLDLSNTTGPGAVMAAQALYAQGAMHSPEQVKAVLGQWADRTVLAINKDSALVTTPDDGLGGYVKVLSARAREDGPFALRLGRQIALTPPPHEVRVPKGLTQIRYGFPKQLSRVYESYLARCVPNSLGCSPPWWHHRMYSLAMNIRGDGPLTSDNLGVSDSAFNALSSAFRNPIRDDKALETTIASWFLDENGRNVSR